MGDSTSFDITWHHGAYYVSIPNYSGGTVYTAEHVARLTRENEAMRKALEDIEQALKGFRYNRDHYPALAAARDKSRAALSSLKETPDAKA